MEREGFFSVEIKSKNYLKNVLISNNLHEKVLIEGFLGEFFEIKIIENALIEFNGANGVLRIDLRDDEFLQTLFMKKDGR